MALKIKTDTNDKKKTTHTKKKYIQLDPNHNIEEVKTF